MFGRSARLAVLSVFLCGAPAAFARSHNFFTNTPLGIGFKTGVERRPRSDFAADPQTVNSLNAFYSFEPFLDFGNFVLKPYVELHAHPLTKGGGTDPANGRAFSETSDPSSWGYGLQLLLVPFVSRDMTSRAYVVAGGGRISTSLRNERTYANGAVYTEKAEGAGEEYIFGAGFELFLAQNYSLALETGYRRFTVGGLGYTNGIDVTGAPRADGETVNNPATGLPKKLHEDGPYLALALNLNF